MFSRVMLMQFDAADRATGDLIDGDTREPEATV
jgi:hypothetical protein